ncbi:U-box domain-containing protein 51 [Sesamum indicum]|uniref:RING-type E3 ubiquitin transferase n=1 Tax=Sesamum indicum TaxID=4182 RepID=A0A6I9TAJ1_SESIN|nr:U-box domain-containing protein 51 [Sesamum indicum]
MKKLISIGSFTSIVTMSPQVLYDNNPTVVAIDKDKNSSLAVRWAIDNLLIFNRTLILIHVRTRNGGGDANGGLAEEVFKPFRAFSARRGIIVKEVVLEGIDVHTTLLDYISSHQVTNIVLGAASRNALTLRKFWTHDLPTLINKAAPDFCSVYVISKGKAQSIRPAATRDVANSTTPRLSPPLASAKSDHFEPENVIRPSPVKGGRKTADSQGVPRKGSRNAGNGNSLDIDSTEPAIDLQSGDTMREQDITVVGKDNDNSLSLSEVLRLKQEMKETMNMYNAACKEAVSAQQRADELQKMKLDEKNRLEQARLAEEAALALVEIEKAKCRAAIEAAEKAQKIAEKEMQRRKQAEMKAKREAEEKYRALDVLSNNDVRYRKYTIDEIQAATDKFAKSMKIGEGGYGPVFKGKLDHTPVAIKVLRPDAAQGRKQFQQEVEVLSCIRHPNMVLLMGACPEYGCLVYEFMDNGSLEDRLFRKGNTPPIPWGIRFKIAADIATGLLFLHQTKPEPLVHRDLKPANVLLDHNNTCKISDVGLARLVPPSVADSVTQYHMTSAAGTFCYIDPEYQQTGELGTKSDIYSLGVMLLQIITARPPMGLTHHVERAIQNETFADLLDPTVPDWPVEEALSFAKLALKCAELRKKDRPDLAKVILPELNRLKDLGMQHGLGHWHTMHG